MDSIYFAAGVIIVLEIANYIVNRVQMRRIEKLHWDMVTGIARDLNRVTSTIALYSGHGLPMADPFAAPGEAGEENPVEAAARKQNLWRNARAGGRK